MTKKGVGWKRANVYTILYTSIFFVLSLCVSFFLGPDERESLPSVSCQPGVVRVKSLYHSFVWPSP